MSLNLKQIEVESFKGKIKELQLQLANKDKTIQHLCSSLDKARGVNRPKSIKPIKGKSRSRKDKIRYIFGDMHGSMAEPEVMQSVINDISQVQPDEIVLLGDMVNCGGFLAERHTLGYVAEIDEASYEQDIAATNSILDDIQRVAPNAKIHYLEGNHEDRVERWCVERTLRHREDAEFLRKNFAPEFLLRLKERGIEYYRRSKHYHDIPVMGVIRLDKCYFTHSNITARHAASSLVGQLGGCVVFGNTHRIQSDTIALASTGPITAWSVGCTCKLAMYWHRTDVRNHAHGAGIQVITSGGKFMHINYPFLGGESLLPVLFNL